MRLSFPSKKTVAKWTLGVLGTIILGALGSGVWQWLLGPAIHAVTRWTLDVASLGLNSYKDGIYQSVAVDSQSRMEAETLFIVTMMYAMLVLAVVIGLYASYVFEKRRGRALLHRIERLSSEHPAEAEVTPERSLESLRQEVRDILRSMGRFGWLVYPWLVFMVLGIGSHFVTLARLGYISQAASHYHQVLRLASPYLDARERAQVESDFAQMGNREDYVKLLSRLEGECKAHGRTAPKFDAW